MYSPDDRMVIAGTSVKKGQVRNDAMPSLAEIDMTSSGSG